jgi:hypothetical protein
MKYLKWILILSLILPLILFFYSYAGLNAHKFLKEVKIIRLDSLTEAGYPSRIASQYVEICKYRFDKNSKLHCPKAFFIADTRDNLIYCFDSNGNFVAKSPIIDGSSPQSKNPDIIKNCNLKWSELAGKMGFKYLKNQYIDTTGKGRQYHNGLVYNYIVNNQLAFFAKGAYKINRVYTDKNYHGGENNVYVVVHNNREIANAVHGLYRNKFREDNLKILVNAIKTDVKNPKVSDHYNKIINQNFRSYAYNNSYGCLNVPESFIKLTCSLAPDSKLFVMGEEKEDYLIKS